MKITTKLILLFLFIVLFTNSSNSQGTIEREWIRKRHNIKGGNYGHPYTIFDSHIG